MWRPYWISDQNKLSYFDLRATQKLSTKFRVNWPFGSGGEGQTRFLRYRPRQLSCISDRTKFIYFDLLVNLMLPTKFQVNCSFVSEEAKIDFQDGGHSGHLISIETI